MTPERFREILDVLGWSRSECARIMRRDPRQVRRWAAGSERDPMDQAAADWLELQAANPPPPVRRRQEGNQDMSEAQDAVWLSVVTTNGGNKEYCFPADHEQWTEADKSNFERLKEFAKDRGASIESHTYPRL